MALEDKSKCCENYPERENHWGELEPWGGGQAPVEEGQC